MISNVVLNLSVSLDGFSAGPDVSNEQPLGVGGERLHEWLLDSSVTSAVDAAITRELADTIGAVIVGKRTFDVGVELWGDTPFPVPCFVLTGKPRPELVMQSSTFTFVTSGIESALQQARAAAGDKSVLLMGGANIAQQYVRAGLVDEIRLQLVPVLLGSGSRPFEGLGAPSVALSSPTVTVSSAVTHLHYRVIK